ncbi:hypothetical protein DY000_02010304 [Brassica cretica]|uniref:DUF7751 domain-containing protein n=1 Tax=Brassica cretica TaxID=69181 RepID=A0ABQ7C335_BRACR|nr:hypothetical protein DY000_02010304 [Brassica cretica]
MSIMVFSADETTNKAVVCAGVPDKSDEFKQLDVTEWLTTALGPLKGRCGKGKSGLASGQISQEPTSVSYNTFDSIETKSKLGSPGRFFSSEHTKDTLVECVSSHIKQRNVASTYGARLGSSSGRILLQSVPGTELYRERLVRALARDSKVPLLILDSSVLAPYDFADDYNEESESDDETAESDDETAESEAEEETDANNDEEGSNEAKVEGSDDEERYLEISKEVLKKLGADIEDIEKRMSGQLLGSSEVPKAIAVDHSDKAKRPLKKGDQVRYVGSAKKDEAKRRAVPKARRKEFVDKVQEMFDKLSGPIVMICGQNKIETGSKEKEKFTMVLPNFSQFAKLPLPLKRLTEGLAGSKRSEENEIYKLFTNVMRLHPPKEEDALGLFKKQLGEDRRIVISRSNINELLKVLEEHELLCTDLFQVNTDGVILTKQKAEKVIGWARNHYLSTCPEPLVKGGRLSLPRESLEISIARLRKLEDNSLQPSQNLKNLCIAAAYRPVQELLQEEQKGEGADASPCLRPLSSDDFIQSKAKVSPSVAYDATTMNELRKWNEQYGEGGSRTKSPFGF